MRSVTFLLNGKGATGWLIKENKKTVVVKVGCKYSGREIKRRKRLHRITIWPEKIIMKNFMSQEKYNEYHKNLKGGDPCEQRSRRGKH